MTNFGNPAFRFSGAGALRHAQAGPQVQGEIDEARGDTRSGYLLRRLTCTYTEVNFDYLIVATLAKTEREQTLSISASYYTAKYDDATANQ